MFPSRFLSKAIVPLAFAVVGSSGYGCVPSRPEEQPEKKARTSSHHGRPHTKKDNRSKLAVARRDPWITKPFEDNFDRPAVGSSWRAVSGVWTIRKGMLCAQNARNHGIWLKRRIPTNARIEFDAVSYSPDGDIKAEVWGDGISGATSVSYTNATSYLTIFGGWKNKLHVLARINEHGADRQAVSLIPNSEDPRRAPVVPGRTYGFRIERTDGRTVTWWVDNVLIHRMTDPRPLKGRGHDHFGFNDWAASVCFDNLRITPLK